MKLVLENLQDYVNIVNLSKQEILILLLVLVIIGLSWDEEDWQDASWTWRREITSVAEQNCMSHWME